jgi:RHS repeat-associated protein
MHDHDSWHGAAVSNPLIAERQDSTQGFTGVPLLESVNETSQAIASGDWASGVMGAAGTALDALGMALDPFGAILSAGVGWLMEHVGPLSDALDALTGDPDQIKAHAQTWTNISQELGSITADLAAAVEADTTHWTGEAADAYRGQGTDIANLVAAAQSAADGAASGIGTAGEVVAAVRTLVRDIIAELVGHLISWALQVLFTLGIGMVWVVPQVVTAVAKTAAKIAKLTTNLVRALGKLAPMLKKLGGSFGDVAKSLKKIKPGKAGGAPPRKPPANTRSAPDTKTPHNNGDGPNGNGHGNGPGGNTSTSSAGPDTKPGNGPNSHGNNGPNSNGNNGPNNHNNPDGPPNTTPQGDKPGPNGKGNGGKGNGGKDNNNLKDDNKDPKQNSTPADCRPGSGDPVDMTTGRMMLGQTDAEITGVLSLVLERCHFSGYRSGVHFGPAWASTMDQRLEVTGDRVDFAAEDGTLLVFRGTDGDGPALPQEGPHWPLRRMPDGEYLLDQFDLGRTLHFADRPGIRRPLTAISDANGNRVEFVRDELGTLTDVRHSAGHRIEVATTDGLVTALTMDGIVLARFAYDDHRYLVEVINSSGQPYRFGYDDRGRITRWQDRNGWSYEFRYDDLDRCVEGIGPHGILDYTFSYDREARVSRATDSLGHTTTYEMNEDFQIVRETGPLGEVTAYEWDRHDRLLASTDPLGRVTRYTYDELGLVTAEIRPDGRRRVIQYDDRRRPVAVVEPDGATWRRTYDQHGRLATVTDPVGGVQRFEHDAAGFPRAFVDEEGHRTEVECDRLGKPLIVTDPVGGRTQFTYDNFGRVRTITDPLGSTVEYSWTVEGALSRRVAPDGSAVRYVRDTEGNAREEIDATGAVTRTDYGPFDLPVSVVAPDGGRTQLAYDTELRLTSVTRPDGATWLITYDPAGRVVQEADFDGRVLTYRYDAVGQLVQRAVNGGEPITYAWNALGRIAEKHVGSAVTTFAYDDAGRMVRAVNPDADLTFTYDLTGRVLSESCNGRTVLSHYDRAGRRVSRRTPSGAVSTWTYDPVGSPVELRTAGRIVRFGYDLAGREIRRDVGAASVTQVWDARNRLTSQIVNGAGLLQHRTYHHRADDVLAGITDLLSGDRDYDLDPLGRITGQRGPAGEERYAYDRYGNIAAANWRREFTPAQGLREYAGSALVRAGNIGYRYDPQGRLVWRDQAGGRGWAFTWDAEDRLTHVRTPDGQQWRYRYDALGRRVAKQQVDGRGEVVFVWDGVHLAEQREIAGTEPDRTTTWDWDPEWSHPVSQAERLSTSDGAVVDERFYAIVTDILGTASELLDDTGRVVWHARRSLWGVTAAEPPGAPTTPLRFPGQYFDRETGLHYNLYRYYDPETGRYTSSDPVGLRGGVHPHNYVSNPTVYLDPLGLKPKKCKGGKSDNPQLANQHGAQPVFHGNQNVPVTEINDKKFVNLLHDLASKRGEDGRRAKRLLELMSDRRWQQTAGVHQGGLGGAAGGADPRPHITLSLGGHGYHVHVGQGNGGLFATDITPSPPWPQVQR